MDKFNILKLKGRCFLKDPTPSQKERFSQKYHEKQESILSAQFENVKLKSSRDFYFHEKEKLALMKEFNILERRVREGLLI
ncbi:hypothetical protein AB834_02855 [PVC group bacterium (ex Bugula neritina AB1)]|nr:hypothetical protein AB834_02855 [PVC group bacterium (ex Bugula neritina AB1)]